MVLYTIYYILYCSCFLIALLIKLIPFNVPNVSNDPNTPNTPNPPNPNKSAYLSFNGGGGGKTMFCNTITAMHLTKYSLLRTDDTIIIKIFRRIQYTITNIK